MHTLVPWTDALLPHFERLNREWLEAHFVVEAKDVEMFRDPKAAFIDGGGTIVFAVGDDGMPVGCAAARRVDETTFELAKMAVTADARGQGIGRRLGEAIIAHARQAGASRVILISNSKLDAALRLYERLGFRHDTPPTDTGYARCDIYMVLSL
ncbi:MAG: GNAT family N-acetyltransferase [Planctomycetota bacterium]